MRWERVSDDVVPVNISCIEDTPDTIFQITAYNRHVEKIFDVKIVQPGTIICPATDCFVHWRDPWYDCEWGLNFTSAPDARKFRDCCSFPTQRFARKASSANSLRLSPPKQRPQAKFSSVSSPNSPVAQSRRVISSPLTLASDVNAQGYASDSDVVDSHDSQCCPPSSSDVGVLNEAATMPRMKHREVHDSRSLHRPALSKPASDVSVYDNVSSSPARRSLAETDSASHTMRRSDSPASMSKLTESTANEESKERPNLVTLSESPKKGSSHSEPETPETCTTFGRDLACSPKDNKMVETVKMETAFVGDIFKNQSPSSNSRGGAGYSAPAASSSSSAVRASAPASGGKGHGRTHPSTSESPESEWPSPPEPLTPQTPNVPFDNIDFDSDSLRRMLRSLPVSPIEKEDNDQGFHEDPYIDNRGQTHHRRYPSVSRTKSLNSYDRGGSSKPSVPHQPYSVGYPCRDDSFVSMLKNTDLPKSKQAKMLVEYELHLRNKCARDSYPDSGIGGVASETTGSLWSGDSSKSAGANKGK
ncbi:Hypothetical predicted protein [Octopus vulgaris]|nr:Hypothetical predicted protein [Octopus vulgaris]